MALTGKIALVIDEKNVAVNRGGVSGQITPNQTWFVRRTQGIQITDPDTNTVLGSYGEIDAWLTVVNVYPHFCICMPTDPTITYARGDVVEINYDGPNIPQNP